MKFVYASLAAVASANFVDNLLSFGDQVFEETQDGFNINLGEYYTGEFTFPDNGFQYIENFYFPGYDADKKFRTQLNFRDEEGNASASIMVNGYYSQIPVEVAEFFTYGLGFPDLSDGGAADEFSYIESANVAYGAAGLNINVSSCLSNGKDQGAPTITGSAELDANVEITGKGMKLLLDAEWENQITGFSPEFAAANKVGPAEINFEIGTPNTKQCERFLNTFKGKKGCNVDFALSWDLPADNQAGVNEEGEIDGSLNFAPMRFLLDVNTPDETNHKIILRGEKDAQGKKMAMLNKGLFYGLYYLENSANGMKDIKKGKATLVLRLPGQTTIGSKVIPALAVMSAPFIEFGEALEENSEAIPALLYNLDQFFATFDDEFDCSNVVRVSGIQSDFGEDGDLNQELQDSCADFNQMLMDDFFKCPDLVAFFEGMREYVAFLASPEGHAQFVATWLSIFQ